MVTDWGKILDPIPDTGPHSDDVSFHFAAYMIPKASGPIWAPMVGPI